jgi:hypothetical protein
MAIEEVKRNKDFLKGRYLRNYLKEMQAQRAALDTCEGNGKNAMIYGDSQCLNDTDKLLASVVQYLSPDGPTREARGKEECLESVVAINSSDCQALKVARGSEICIPGDCILPLSPGIYST